MSSLSELIYLVQLYQTQISATTIAGLFHRRPGRSNLHVANYFAACRLRNSLMELRWAREIFLSFHSVTDRSLSASYPPVLHYPKVCLTSITYPVRLLCFRIRTDDLLSKIAHGFIHQALSISATFRHQFQTQKINLGCSSHKDNCWHAKCPFDLVGLGGAIKFIVVGISRSI